AMDSGNGHLAAMYGIPVLTLWGVTHPYAGFAPFRQHIKNQLVSDRSNYPKIPTSVYGNNYPKHYENAMGSIPVDLVVQKVLGLLQ
ncbi:MAG: ADP-heptose--LPS heptosyltransferase RfaF, partial [Marinirhabdus sp.]